MLRGGRGAAFSVTPAAGVLEAFSAQALEVTCFSDMWGEYEDGLVCSVRLILFYVLFVCVARCASEKILLACQRPWVLAHGV